MPRKMRKITSAFWGKELWEWKGSELKLLFPDKHVALVNYQYKLLNTEPLPPEFKSRVLELLEAAGVEVMFGQRQ